MYEFLVTFSLDPKHNNPIVQAPKPKKDVSLMTEEDQIAYAMRQSLGQAPDKDEADEDSDIEIVEEIEIHKDEGKSVTLGQSESTSQVLEPRAGSGQPSKTNITAVPGQEQDQERKEELEPKSENESEPEGEGEESIFASISADRDPEPEAQPGNGVTRIQFRLADGTRLVRRFKTSDTVRKMFGVVKAVIESAADNYFSLTSERKKLISMLDLTIEEAGLKNSSVLVEILN